MNAVQQYILYTYPKAATTINSEVCHAYGASDQASCEAAASNLDRETTGFMVLPLEPLAVPQSALSKELDERSKQRAEHMRELQNG